MPSLKELLDTPPPLLWPQPPSEKASAVEKTVLELETLSQVQLREAWIKRYGKPVPAPRSTSLLLRLLAWRIQADAFGGHKPEVLRVLNAPITPHKVKKKPSPDADLPNGTILKRDWKGAVHHVHVTKEGFGHKGTTYKTLSEAAHAITGTKWSGPRFFGLKDSKNRPRLGAGP